jgi:hypothetical protein
MITNQGSLGLQKKYFFPDFTTCISNRMLNNMHCAHIHFLCRLAQVFGCKQLCASVLQPSEIVLCEIRDSLPRKNNLFSSSTAQLVFLDSIRVPLMLWHDLSILSSGFVLEKVVLWMFGSRMFFVPDTMR